MITNLLVSKMSQTGLFETAIYHELFFHVGPSGVRALPLAAGTNEGGHYFGPSGVRALPLAAGINEGGHYFGPSVLRAPAEQTKVATVLGN